MSSYYWKNMLLGNTSQAVAAEADEQAVSIEFPIRSGDAEILMVMVEASGHSGTVTAKLQDSHDGETWADAGSVSVSGDGTFEIAHNIHDGSTDPLWPLARVVVTTAAASGVTIDKVTVTRR